MMIKSNNKDIDICSQILYHITYRLGTTNQEKIFDERRTDMSVVIIADMTGWYVSIRKYADSSIGKAKVFTQMSASLGKQIGSPDLVVLFTNTVSHKMVSVPSRKQKKCHASIVRCHTSSKNALEEILGNACA